MNDLHDLAARMLALLNETQLRRIIPAIAAEIAGAVPTAPTVTRAPGAPVRPKPPIGSGQLTEDELESLRALRAQFGPKGAGAKLGISPEAASAIARNGRGRADFIAAIRANLPTVNGGDNAIADLDAARVAARGLI
jgi:hypothetical protein